VTEHVTKGYPLLWRPNVKCNLSEWVPWSR